MRGGASNRGCVLARAGRFVAALFPITPGVRAQRVRKRRRAVDLRVLNVVDGRAFGGIQSGCVANALGDFMVGARGITADAEAADARLAAVKRQPAAECDGAAANLADRARITRPAQARRVQ